MRLVTESRTVILGVPFGNDEYLELPERSVSIRVARTLEIWLSKDNQIKEYRTASSDELVRSIR